MGKYIEFNSKRERVPAQGKADFLIADGAREIEVPEVLQPNMVCVVENPTFDAALYVEDERQFMMTVNQRETRKRRFLIYDHAKTTTG